MLDHPSDEGMLMPKRHKNSDAPLGGLFQVRIGRPGKPSAPPRQVNRRDEQVVQSAQQDPDRQRNQTCRDPGINRCARQGEIE
jgi:hypothetical protein